MLNNNATCIVTSDDGRILRNTNVTSFEEVKAIHAKLPRNMIAIFENANGKGGEMWLWVPGVDCWR